MRPFLRLFAFQVLRRAQTAMRMGFKSRHSQPSGKQAALFSHQGKRRHFAAIRKNGKAAPWAGQLLFLPMALRVLGAENRKLAFCKLLGGVPAA